MADYLEDRVETLESGLLNLLVNLIDFKCPSCGCTWLFVSSDKTLMCEGKGCCNEYSIGQITEYISSNNKVLTFHPSKNY